MYFPKSQTTTNLHTNGNELFYKDNGLGYIGYYWKTSSSKYYTGKNPQEKPTRELIIDKTSNVNEEEISSNKMILNIEHGFNRDYIELKNISSSKIIDVPTYLPQLPSSQNYTNGSFKRYFCKKTNQTIYLEINKDTYDRLVKQDKSILFQLYIPFSIPWILNGNKGRAAQLNANATTTVVNKLQLPRFLEFIGSNFTKYYKHYKYSEVSNLYTKGNELKTVQDNKMYIGFYHIHPDKGYMVGATHILEPHAYLSPINGFSYSGPSFKDTSKPSPNSNTPPSTGGGMSSGGGSSGGGGY